MNLPQSPITSIPPTKPLRRRSHLEYDIQTEFFCVIRKLAKVDERWRLVYSVPNGSAQSMRSRLHEYRMGLTRGVSDVCVDLPSADGRYGFLRIEFKTPAGVQSTEQLEYERLVTLYGGGLYVVCRSSDEAFRAISAFLGLDSEAFMAKIQALKPRRARRAGYKPSRTTKSPKDAFFCL